MLPFFHNSQCFEKKVRKELEAIGFLDPTNESNQVHDCKPNKFIITSVCAINTNLQDDSDEVLNELTRCQDELQTVAAKNKKILSHLLQVTKTEYKRQQIKNQIKILNSEVNILHLLYLLLKFFTFK